MESDKYSDFYLFIYLLLLFRFPAASLRFPSLLLLIKLYMLLLRTRISNNGGEFRPGLSFYIYFLFVKIFLRKIKKVVRQ
jgi:hypothetical protein